ncbi:hypothetical protein [Sediminibacterium sp.]|uniref:hypothetical protein n=1 Tax=Sediminibacterium sp. TaxID=1917865 RepID=UPI003F7052AE
MKRSFLLSLILVLGSFLSVSAQNIVYSEPDRDDPRTLNFEVVGKMNGKFLIYKNARDDHFFSIYDTDMKLSAKVKMDYLPERAKILGTDFVSYPDFAYFIYQYQLKNVYYVMAAKIGSDGKIMADPILLDTTAGLGYAANNRIYTVLNSEDKQRIAAFKVSTRNEKEHVITSCVFDKQLTQLEKVRVPIEMPDRNDYLGEFGLDNEGTLVFLRESSVAQNESINKVSLVVKPLGSINPTISEVKVKSLFLDDTRIKIDNLNKKILITSFFSKQKRGNIDGLYYTLWDKQTGLELLNATTVFSEEFRADVRGEGSAKTAFNDFYLKNLILRRDGGFMMIAESAYMNSRGNTFNRWDMMNRSPFFNPYVGSGLGFGMGGFYPYGSGLNAYPWGSPWGLNSMGPNNVTRYFSDNIAIISFEPDGKMEWSNVIRKTQYDDNTDNYIGYGLVNSGDQIRFLFNIQDKRSNILTDQSLSPKGQIDRNPTIKNLERGYDFMPRHAKQTGSRQAIIPCMFRGYTCFAKIDY